VGDLVAGELGGAARQVAAPLTTSNGYAHTHRYKWWYAQDVTALIGRA
jgi:hypothetical protein